MNRSDDKNPWGELPTFNTYYEPDEQDARIAQLEKQNEIMKEALIFYSDRENWDYLNQNTRGFLRKDLESNINFTERFGGKKAREALAKLEGEK